MPFVALLLALACSRSTPAPELTELPTISEALREGVPRRPGDLAPDGPLYRIDVRGEVTLKGLLEEEGTRAVLVLFVADWCSICAAALPEVERLRQQTPGLEVLVFSADANDLGRRKLLDKLDRLGLRAPTVMGTPPALGAWLGQQQALPQFFFVDGTGRIVAHELGYDDAIRGRLAEHAQLALGGGQRREPR